MQFMHNGSFHAYFAHGPKDSWLVIEHAAKTAFPMSLGCTKFLRRYRYGDTVLSLYFRPHTVQA